MMMVIKKKSMTADARDFASRLKKAVGNGDITTVRRIIKGGIDINVKSNFWYNSTLLHHAISSGHVPIVKLLIQAKVDINAANEEGRTALHLASRAGNSDIVQELIKNGANINAVTKDKRTALQTAIWRGKKDVVQCLLAAGANVNCNDEDGWSPLFWAARSNFLEIAELLVEYGAELDHQNTDGQTAVQEALGKGHLDMVQFLVREGADINFHNQDNKLVRVLLANKHVSVPSALKLLDFCHVHGLSLQGNSLLRAEKLPPHYAKDEKFTQWLQDTYNEVPSLCSMCRNYVRNRISMCNGGRSISRKFDQLQLPRLLSDYLSFKYEVHDARIT